MEALGVIGAQLPQQIEGSLVLDALDDRRQIELLEPSAGPRRLRQWYVRIIPTGSRDGFDTSSPKFAM